MNAEQFLQTKVSDCGKLRWGKRIMREMVNCDNQETANNLLAVAYWHKVTNYDEIENLFWVKFPNALQHDQS